MSRRPESGTLSVAVSPSDHTQGPEPPASRLSNMGTLSAPTALRPILR